MESKEMPASQRRGCRRSSSHLSLTDNNRLALDIGTTSPDLSGTGCACHFRRSHSGFWYIHSAVNNENVSYDILRHLPPNGWMSTSISSRTNISLLSVLMETLTLFNVITDFLQRNFTARTPSSLIPLISEIRSPFRRGIEPKLLWTSSEMSLGATLIIPGHIWTSITN